MQDKILSKQLLDDLFSYCGVKGFINRFGHIVVSESDMVRLHEKAMNDQRLSAIGRGYYLGGGVPVESAPDWTFDPQAMAWLRFIVILRLPKIVKWVSRRLP